MHEFSIASGLVEKLLDFAEKNPDKKIVEVRVAIGEFTQIEEEQLRFCYESIITEMPIAGSRLTIEPVLGKVACPHCSYSGPPKYWDGALARYAHCHSRMSRLRERGARNRRRGMRDPLRPVHA